MKFAPGGGAGCRPVEFGQVHVSPVIAPDVVPVPVVEPVPDVVPVLVLEPVPDLVPVPDVVPVVDPVPAVVPVVDRVPVVDVVPEAPVPVVVPVFVPVGGKNDVLTFDAKELPNTCRIRSVNAWFCTVGRFCGLIANCCSVAIGTLKLNVFGVLENADGVNGNGNVCPWKLPRRN